MAERKSNTDENEVRSNPQDNPGGTETPKTEGSHTKAVLAAARISTSRPLGASRVDRGLIEFNVGDNSVTSPVAGIMVLDYIPTLGVSESATSALSRAAANEFNAIRSQISGNRPYEPVDHMIYRICVDSMRELYTYIKRAWRILTHYSATNLYRPLGYLTAMGLNANDWNANREKIYQWLLTHAKALEQFPTVPIGRISDRRIALNEAFFLDGEIEGAQTYIFNQVAFYSYEVVDKVKGVTLRKMGKTWNETEQLWDTMYTALASSSDVFTMTADIRRAFADKVITDLPVPTAATEEVPIAKFDVILEGIQNSTILGVYQSDDPDDTKFQTVLDAFRIQDKLGNGALYCRPKWTLTFDGTIDNVAAFSSHVNSQMQEPSADNVINMMRFRLAGSTAIEYRAEASQFVSVTSIDAMGTEVLLNAKILRLGGGTQENPFTVLQFASLTPNIEPTLISEIANFDWHPCIYFTVGTFSGTTENNLYPLEDVQNYIPVYDTDVQQLHDALLLENFELD